MDRPADFSVRAEGTDRLILREGAANLQGIWAAEIGNPWGSKWTINVNTEMNYWVAEPADLGRDDGPLYYLLDMVRTPANGTGQRVAQEHYRSRGFVTRRATL